MAKSFDDILQEGKDRASTNPFDTVKKWRSRINAAMSALDELNWMYEDGSTRHHISVEYCKCKKCKKASYLIIVRDISEPKRIITFHRSKWKSINKDTYYCDECG